MTPTRLFAFFLAFVLLTLSSARAYKHGMTMATPAEGWRDALPSGNGQIGALVYGAISEERVLFNHNELWYQGRTSEIPDMSAELPVVRGLLDQGKYLEANGDYQKKLKSRGFNGANSIYHPAFDLILQTQTEHMFEDYARTLDFETGEIAVQWRDGERRFARRLFVSIPDNVAVMTIRGDKAGAVAGAATLDIHNLKDAILQNGEQFDPGFKYQTVVSGEFIEFRASGSGRGEFGGVARVVVKNGSMPSALPNSDRPERGQRNSIRFNGADEVLVVIGLFANEPSDTAVPRLKQELAALGDSYEALYARHQPQHAARFNAMGVRLGSREAKHLSNEQLLLDAYQGKSSPELMQKLFDYGRYLLISSSRAGGYPANLQGIWNGDYRPPWSSLYGINENLQMTYWQGLPGNMNESMMAFYDYFDAHLDDFRYNAKQLWGTRGIYVPPFMSPDSGKLRITAPHVIYWTDAAGWLASFYYDHYLFTGDTTFLQKRAIPFMKEVALFYEDFIVKDAHGKNLFYPSQSPENQPPDKTIVDPETGRRTTIKVQINSVIAVAIAKEVLTNLVASCELLGIEQTGVARWKKLLADMPAYEINEDGAMREWLHPDFKDNYEHRHMSHIYPLFPGHELSEESNPELYLACKIAISKRLEMGLSSQTGWSLAHMANINARLGEGEKAWDALRYLTRACLGKNFFTYHNDWRKMGTTMDFGWGRTAPFQMDANFGVTAAITEMLCSSSAEMVKLLPALPSEWPTGEIHDVQTRVGAGVNIQWDLANKIITADLTAGRANTFTLKLPANVSALTASLPSMLAPSPLGESYRRVRLQKDQELTLQMKLR